MSSRSVRSGDHAIFEDLETSAAFRQRRRLAWKQQRVPAIGVALRRPRLSRKAIATSARRSDRSSSSIAIGARPPRHYRSCLEAAASAGAVIMLHALSLVVGSRRARPWGGATSGVAVLGCGARGVWGL